MEQIIPIKDADRSFDLRFWKRVGAERRFAAAWQIIGEIDGMPPVKAVEAALALCAGGHVEGLVSCMK